MADSKKSIEIAITSDTTGIVGGLKKVKQQAGDTKKTTDELQTSLEDLGGEVKAKVTVDDGQAQTRLDTVKKQIEGLDNEQAKIVVDANITSLEGQIKKVKGELTTLSDEDVKLAVDVIGNGEQQLQDLKQLSSQLGTEKVTLDVDTEPLETAAGRAKGGVDSIGKSADSSRSALANMVGNSAQDLGDVAGVAGSAGVAVGQMAEYFADATLAGEGFSSALKSFALVAGPIAALSIAVPILSAAWTDLTDHQTAAEKSAKKLKDAQDALKQGSYDQAVSKLVTSYSDLFDAADKAGVPVSDVVDYITGAKDSFKGAGDSIETTSGFLTDLQPHLDDARAGWELNNEQLATNEQRTKDVAAALGLQVDAQGKVVEALDNGGISADEYQASVEKVTEATEASKQALLDEAGALKSRSDAMFAASDSSFALQQATRDQDQAFHDLDATVAQINASTDDADTKQRKLADAYETAAEKATGVADAAVRVAQDQATAAGATLGATQKLDTWNASMLGSAATANGALHEAIVNHIASVNGIPPEKVTEILAATPNIDEQKRLLDEASANRKLTITADADTSQATTAVDAFVRSVEQKTAYIDVKARTGNVSVATAGGTQSLQPRPYANGGDVMTLVGERGPEVGILPTGTNITPNERARNWIQTAAREAVGSVAALTNNYYQTYTFLSTINDREVARQVRRYERRNGSVTIA